MKKIKLSGIEEKIIYEKLPNGLDVYLYNKEGVTNNYVTFTTKFGSIYNEFIPINEKKTYKIPNGVAHFLEHKVFVQETDPQPEEFFSKSGALSNAYTTFKNTTYLFSGPNNLKENILFLLDYVQSPYFTKENVDSEKGIITQEINMYEDNPTDVLYEKIRENVFHNNPYKHSVIGTTEDINKVTEKMLYKCYNTFYNPENMFLVVTGSFNEEEILNAISENQSKKEFKQLEKLEVKKFKEPNEVLKKKEIINRPTEIPKVSYNIKISLDNLYIDKKKYNLYLFVIFNILFDDTSYFDEEAKNENLITNTLNIELLNTDTHMLVSLINETTNYEALLEKIKNTLDNISIKESDLERKKRVLISNELFSFENIEIINEMIVDNIIYENKIETSMIDLIKSMNIEELNKIIKELDLTNKSIVIVKDK